MTTKKKADAAPKDPSVADGPAAERPVVEVVPAEAPDSFQYLDRFDGGRYEKQADGSYVFNPEANLDQP